RGISGPACPIGCRDGRATSLPGGGAYAAFGAVRPSAGERPLRGVGGPSRGRQRTRISDAGEHRGRVPSLSARGTGVAGKRSAVSGASPPRLPQALLAGTACI